jgi:hypothetical protein
MGGLCASGHALGSSGLFQVAKAFHCLTRDVRYVSYGQANMSAYEAQLGATQYVVTSVGSALTNIIATLIIDESEPAARERLVQSQRAYDPDAIARAFGKQTADPLFEPAVAALSPGEGIVIAATQVKLATGPAWTYLVGTRAGGRLALGRGAADPAAHAAPAPIGARVSLVEEGGRCFVDSVGAPAVTAPPPAPGVAPAVAAQIAAARAGRLAERY